MVLDTEKKYAGADIIQEDMPVAGYICGEQDNVRYQPNVQNDDLEEATFTNTHHPLESNDVEWKKVELSWTRHANDKYNILDQNQSNACEDGTTNGFNPLHTSPAEILTPDPNEHYIGSYSLKCVTPNSVSGEGFSTVYKPVIPEFKYGHAIRLKGSGTVTAQLFERDEDGTSIQYIVSSAVTLSSSWQKITLPIQFSTGTQISIKVVTTSKQAATIYADGLIINVGDPDPNWVEGPLGNFSTKVSLYGLMIDGEPELIEEYVNNMMYPVDTAEPILFDLGGGAGEPPLIKSPGATTPGKLRLELPMTLQNYDSIILKHSPYAEGWSNVKILPVTGTIDFTYPNYVIGPYTILSESTMKTDFGDLRVAIWDGTQFVNCRYYIFTKLDGVSANVFVEIPNLPISPAITNLFFFYGNPDAVTTSDPTIIYFYDDFEDGKYTGRSGNYVNWTVAGGTASIVSSGQISGVYSLKHTGATTGDGIPMYVPINTGSCIVTFDFKLLAQGSGTYDPYIALWYLQYVDSSNFVRVEAYWSGTQQQIRLVKKVSGTPTILSTFNWQSSKWALNNQQSFKIYYNGSNVTVFMGSTKIINNVAIGSTFSSTRCGMGCLQTAQGEWESIRVRYYMPNSVSSNGNAATIGTLTGEGSEVSPDSWDDESQRLMFTLPPDYIDNIPICFDITEIDSSTYESPDTIANNKDIFKIGHDHTAKYHALRIVIETIAEAVDSIAWNYIKYTYSIDD